MLAVGKIDNRKSTTLPSILKGIPLWINNVIFNALYEWFPLKVWDPVFEMYEEKAAFREFTKTVSKSLLFLITFVRELLLGGDKTIDLTGETGGTIDGIYNYTFDLESSDVLNSDWIGDEIGNWQTLSPPATVDNENNPLDGLYLRRQHLIMK